MAEDAQRHLEEDLEDLDMLSSQHDCFLASPEGLGCPALDVQEAREFARLLARLRKRDAIPETWRPGLRRVEDDLSRRYP